MSSIQAEAAARPLSERGERELEKEGERKLERGARTKVISVSLSTFCSLTLALGEVNPALLKQKGTTVFGTCPNVFAF